MYKIRLIFAVISLTLMLPSSVSASCIDYFQGKQYLEVEARKLAFDDPALILCMGACSTDSNPEGCVMVACGLTCLAVGLDKCVNFFNKAFALQRYQQRLETLNNGCE